MNCTKDHYEQYTTFIGIQASLDDVCAKLKTYEDGIKPCPAPRDRVYYRDVFHTYVASYRPETLRFKCYPYNQLSPRPNLLRLNFPLLVYHRDVFHTYVASYRPETLRFKCYPYHQLDHGDLVLNCLANGTWNGTEPSCSPIPGRNKWFVMLQIVLSCLAIAFVVLTTDFIVWRIQK
ncbi:hypothetical protein ElyMa_003255700 [Elysia marginata]|uniref:Sushi domain-containing protein n=1 Tax=Elysia marginata TaxID=1093978 RepID=A0AAV4J6S7_9GAST|nr:hypothetical protein ElyMa_003255700 [Elysia marginata]